MLDLGDMVLGLVSETKGRDGVKAGVAGAVFEPGRPSMRPYICLT